MFATYQPDPSGFLYADQRYYNSGWGRYLTADPSDANVNLSISGSFNRFAYVNGDPANGSDPHGTSDCPGDSCGNDGNGSNNGGDGDGGYPGLCDPSDPSGLSCSIGGLAGTNGSGPGMIPSLTLGEATQLETLMQQGIINGWTLTPTGVDLSLLPAAATAGAIACATDPICVVAAGIGLTAATLYVAYKYLPSAVKAIQRATKPTLASWPPCIPPVGTVGYRYDAASTSRLHFPFPGDHVHLYVMSQGPTGVCFWSPIGVVDPPPPPDAVPMTPAAGGTN